MVEHVIVAYTHQLRAARENFKKAGVMLHVITNFAAIVEVAFRRRYLKKEEVEVVKAWRRNPALWGKRMGFE